MPIGAKGLVPTSKMYKKMYKGAPIRSSYIISNAIGQGEILTSPMQLANMMATVANRGFYYTPHIVKSIKNQTLDKKFTTRHYTTINKKYFEPIIQGLEDVYNHGTGAGFRVEGIKICGKTGTAENKIRVGGKTYQLKDHSIFVAFAPRDNPKIAIAVFIENSGYGATWAGPIATLMIEKYINGKISRTDLEERMLKGSLAPEYKKIENIIYQRISRSTEEDTALSSVESQLGEAKKEEEND
jgi:penicillin-binding protein 2